MLTLKVKCKYKNRREIIMEFNPQVAEFITYIQKIYNQGELEPFIDLVQTPNRLLLSIAMSEKVRPSELSESLRVSRPTITSNLKDLEEKGFLTRMINPDNRREVYVTLTREGQLKFEKEIEVLTGLFADWFRILGPEETQHVINILKISCDISSIGDMYKKVKI